MDKNVEPTGLSAVETALRQQPEDYNAENLFLLARW
jgi:hypothetical protein